MAYINIKSAADLQRRLNDLPEFSSEYQKRAIDHQNSLTKPPGSLGKLEEVATWLAGWQKNERPIIKNASCIVFAGNHGVAAKGVSAFPTEVTAQMVENFKNGGAAINQLTEISGASLKVVSLDINQPTHDFTLAPAMSAEECANAIQAGADAVTEKTDILLLGEMGIGNTTSAAAVALSTFGEKASDWVGYGTGIDEKTYEFKKDVVGAAVELHKNNQNNAFDILRTVGGRELAAISGAVLEARQRRIPVILDGFISTSAASVLLKDNDKALDHTLVSHLSVEPGHKMLTEFIKKPPLLNLEMRLGEASGAAVALLIVKAALATHNGMATFDQAGVSNND